MSSAMALRMFRSRVAAPRTLITRRWASATAGQASSSPQASGKGGKTLKMGAKKDPELYILLGIMAGAFGLAGYYFGRKPTAATSESSVSMADGSMPWQTEGDGKSDNDFKYQYHPRGDMSQAPKNAPSALNTVIVPNVTLPKDLHDQFNKWGKDGY